MIEVLFERGYERLYAADPTGAVGAFVRVVLLDPGHGEAWAVLADALSDSTIDSTENFRSAKETPTSSPVLAYARAVAVDPQQWMWRLGWAEALRRSGDLPRALALFADLARDRADSAPVRLGHARALNAAGKSDAALAEYREAVSLRPDDTEAALELADALIASGDALAAVELLQPLARRHAEDAALHHAIGQGWIALREPDKALVALRRARDLDPDDRLGSAAAIQALEAGEGADLSAAYVRALFDRYADRFDRDLLGKLGYAAPDLLRAAVDRVSQPTSEAGLRILDLGCGTGLAGVTFRPLAGFLAGVDLSPRMVDKARDRRIYDELAVGDVVAAMDAAPAAWDLLVAADVLVYIGDLAPVFQAAARALVPGGRFAATVERAAEGEGFVLGPTRRYAHAESHLCALAEAVGLTIRLLEPCTPRREKGVGVPGLLFIVER
ncbi:tetratricopeptide repeat protein [Azospirillum griseum]|uniref:Tetratricopeptide repeat protein n=1 Tax=Azospirillum griseum TaxID=2496639 RepID=A0A431VLK0_9PROT|nr:tetratricopeptide repeat protein [Azospirillum griseum]RTR23531.1 tetratricopeptide repeat protein [Azospirillum griseum]